MKAKDLKSPYSWEERKPCIQDKVFYVPDYYAAHGTFSFPAWKDAEIFNRSGPVMIEFCSGNGEWILSKAKTFPHMNWVGVDLLFSRVSKMWAKAKNANLHNFFIVFGEAFTFAQHYIPSQSVDEVFINFPDPWPKQRHHKHRIIQPHFIKELERILKREGKVTFVTDDISYREWTLRHFFQNHDFEALHPEPYYVEQMDSYGSSFFDTLWREKGRSIFYLQFVKKS